MRVNIRWMIRRDFPSVLGIDRTLDADSLLHTLQKPNCIGMVAEQDGVVVGFMVYELHTSKLRLLNLAVDHGYRRLGIGAQMVAKLIGKLSGHRRNRIVLAVPETSLGAQLFFRRMGFKAVKVVRKYYESGHDAYVMSYRVPTHAHA